MPGNSTTNLLKVKTPKTCGTKIAADSLDIVLPDSMNICIFHNGNSRIVELYKQNFPSLKFCGNLTNCNYLDNIDNCLWEVCFTDATREILTKASEAGITIVRHISTYSDDMENLLPECIRFDYVDWLNFVVTKNMSFADEIISEFELSTCVDNNKTIIITTGRTANMHFQEVLSKYGIQSFENEKMLNDQMFNSTAAVLMWREDQWECLSSIWIAKNTKFVHNTQNQPELTIEVDPVELTWIDKDWYDMAQIALDYALFFKFILKKHITIMTTERAISGYISNHKKVNYNKQKTIKQCDQTKQLYQNSAVAKTLNLLYNKVQKQIKIWKEPDNA
jgi:hypothetical protein